MNKQAECAKKLSRYIEEKKIIETIQGAVKRLIGDIFDSDDNVSKEAMWYAEQLFREVEKSFNQGFFVLFTLQSFINRYNFYVFTNQYTNGRKKYLSKTC